MIKERCKKLLSYTFLQYNNITESLLCNQQKEAHNSIKTQSTYLHRFYIQLRPVGGGEIVLFVLFLLYILTSLKKNKSNCELTTSYKDAYRSP